MRCVRRRGIAAALRALEVQLRAWLAVFTAPTGHQRLSNRALAAQSTFSFRDLAEAALARAPRLRGLLGVAAWRARGALCGVHFLGGAAQALTPQAKHEHVTMHLCSCKKSAGFPKHGQAQNAHFTSRIRWRSCRPDTVSNWCRGPCTLCGIRTCAVA